MGADGHIEIWSDKKVRDEFPNCDDLFCCLPTHYKHTLNGETYHHVYWGDNMCVEWDCECDWYIRMEENNKKEELRKFVNWLLKNIDASWEVWT